MTRVILMQRKQWECANLRQDRPRGRTTPAENKLQKSTDVKHDKVRGSAVLVRDRLRACIIPVKEEQRELTNPVIVVP